MPSAVTKPRVDLRRAFAAALFAALALPAGASAEQRIQAVDGVLADGSDNRWTPNDVTVKVGETVTWSFTGTTLAHNVRSSSPNWTLESPIGVAGAPVSGAFASPGTYAFVCRLHASMTGAITVTDATGAPPPPPPPPPLSEQPFPNDAGALTSFERIDAVAPVLSAVRVRRVTRGARVRFRLSESGRATLALKRGGKTVKTRAVDARKGTNSVTIRGLRAGGYRIEVRARDLSGNAARVKRTRVTVR
jgi:plastocyanin